MSPADGHRAFPLCQFLNSPTEAYGITYGSASTPDGTCGWAIGSTTLGDNSTGCAYIYGYDMVQGITVPAATIVGDIPRFNSVTGGDQLYKYPTWLDVETGNSWLSDKTMNIADLQGMVDAIDTSVPAGSTTIPAVGIYSTSYQWGQITGTPSSTATGGNLWGIPDWIPGARNKSGAASNCSLYAFTEPYPVHPVITQWLGHPYDGDYVCP